MTTSLIAGLFVTGCGPAPAAASRPGGDHWRVVPIALSAPCAPKPCALVGGLEIRISNIQREAVPPANAEPGPSGTHYARLDVSFVSLAGTHTVYDPHSAMPVLIDEDGPDSMTNSSPDGSVSYQMANVDPFCGPRPIPSFAPGAALDGNVPSPLGTLKPGDHVGPVHMCFWVKGPVNQRLIYAWWPSIVPDTPGTIYEPVRIPLP